MKNLLLDSRTLTKWMRPMPEVEHNHSPGFDSLACRSLG